MRIFPLDVPQTPFTGVWFGVGASPLVLTSQDDPVIHGIVGEALLVIQVLGGMVIRSFVEYAQSHFLFLAATRKS